MFSTSILIQNIPTVSYISPTITAKSYPTTFKAKLASNGTITKYIWDFGDGTALYETSSNEAKHTYASLGNYTIQIKVQGNNTGTTTSSFPVQVVSSMEVVPEMLKNSITNLEKIKKQLDNFSSFEKFSVNYSLDLPYLESLVKSINSSIERGMNESGYDKALGDLINYEIPFLS
jgi:PKD repeat protein